MTLARGILRLGLLLAATPILAAEPPEARRGSARVLVISAPSAADAALRAQDAILAPAAAALRERDVVVVRLVGVRAQTPHGHALGAQGLRRTAGLSERRFGVVLIGKDGHVALRSSKPITAETLSTTIDAMPMRREEMRRGER